MSYDKAMFHRMADEMRRIASEGDMPDEDDVFTALNALGLIVANEESQGLASACLGIATCEHGGMYEVFQELPDCIDSLFEELAKGGRVERYESEDGDVIYVRRA